MADNSDLAQAIGKVLSNLQTQVSEMQAACQEAQSKLEQLRASGSDDVRMLLPSLLRFQAASTSVTASVEFMFRFVGTSAGVGSIPMMTLPVAAAVPATAPAPAPVAAPAPPPVAAPAPPPAAAPAPPPVAAPEPAPFTIEEPEPVAVPVVQAAPAPVAAPAPAVGPIDIETLSPELKKLHKKAARFSRVAVQEFLLYKKEEAEAGRQSKDLYRRFKEEIDKTKEQYDEKFKDIAVHNVDYFYDELVKTLANNDVSALGGYSG